MTTACSDCPSQLVLDALIQGKVSEDETNRLTDHLEKCTTCQAALQKVATGTLPIDALVENLHKLNPSSQSAYWTAIAQIESSHSGVEIPTDFDVRTDSKGNSNDQSPRSLLARSKKQSAAGLDFLEPSDNPDYIGRLHYFQVARVIGRGGMGIVFEAFDTHLHRTVAIKVLNPEYQDNEIARQRFCREGRAAAAISHEHVVPMYHVANAHEGEIAYLVMQLIEGDTLESRLREGVAFTTQDIARIGMQIAAGLSAAHKRGMVHRDIKPANILIEGETDRVKLTDFGLARTTDDVKLTSTGMVAGTPLYMSPEQTLGEPTEEASDLFSLGVVLYEMSTGIAPFQAPSAIGVMKRIMEFTPDAPHKINPAITRPLSELIMLLMAKKPSERPESASAVASALASIVTEFGPISPLQLPSVAATEVKKISGGYRRLERRWVVTAWLVAAIGIISLVISAFSLMRQHASDHFPSVVLSGNPGTVWSVDFAPSGQQLAAAIEDGSVRIWNIEKQSLLKSFNAHRGIVWMVAYHPTREWVVTSGDDGFIKLWKANTFELDKEWRVGSAIRSIAFSPDGERIVAGDREGTIHIYSIINGDELHSKNQPGSILGVDYSSDGRLIASVGSDKMVRVWDADSLAERQTISGHDGPIYGVRFAAKGPMLASVGWNKNVRVWNFETGAEVANLVGSEGDVWGLSFCSDGTHLVTGDNMGATRVWDLSTNRPVVVLRGHTSAVHNVSLDSVNRRIATSSRDGTIRVWDLSGLEE